jgi:hypothetical protein
MSKSLEINRNEFNPSHIMTGDYAVLMETSGEEMESWYYFIRVEGNEENLKNFQAQLEDVEWYVLDDNSTFDLDLEHYVSAQTAKEMTNVELNHCSFHRKFDGKLQKIDFGFAKKDKNKKKIRKVNDVLGYGLIEEFIDDEDINPEDLLDGSGSESDDTDNESVSSSDSEDSRERRRQRKKNKRDESEKSKVEEIDDRDDVRDGGLTTPPSSRLRDAIKDKQSERKRR